VERVELADVVSTEALDELPNSAGVCSAHRQIADDSHLCVSLLFFSFSAVPPKGHCQVEAVLRRKHVVDGAGERHIAEEVGRVHERMMAEDPRQLDLSCEFDQDEQSPPSFCMKISKKPSQNS